MLHEAKTGTGSLLGPSRTSSLPGKNATLYPKRLSKRKDGLQTSRESISFFSKMRLNHVNNESFPSGEEMKKNVLTLTARIQGSISVTCKTEGDIGKTG